MHAAGEWLVLSKRNSKTSNRYQITMSVWFWEEYVLLPVNFLYNYLSFRHDLTASYNGYICQIARWLIVRLCSNLSGPWIRCLVFRLKFQKNDNLIAPFKSAVNIMEQLFFISYIRKYINSGSIWFYLQ